MHRALAASRRQALTASVGKLADRAGRFVGAVRRSAIVRTLPGAAGAVAVSIGLGEIYRPLLLIALGAFALILDNRAG